MLTFHMFRPRRIHARPHSNSLNLFVSYSYALFCHSHFSTSRIFSSLRTLLKTGFLASLFESVFCALFSQNTGVGGPFDVQSFSGRQSGERTRTWHSTYVRPPSIRNLLTRLRAISVAHRGHLSQTEGLVPVHNLPHSPVHESQVSNQESCPGLLAAGVGPLIDCRLSASVISCPHARTRLRPGLRTFS